MKNSVVAGLFVTVAVLGSPASAAEVVVTNTASPLPAGQNWGTLPGENTGTIEITGTAPRSGTGSVEIRGDRTRLQTGVQFGGNAGATSITSLDNVASLTYDYRVASDSQRTNYTPALRLLVQDGAQRSELIWEGVYNDSVPNGVWDGSVDTWFTTSASDRFWQFVSGSGANETGGQLQLMTIAQWAASTFYTDSARVSALSVGAGSGAGANYHGFADNVKLALNDGTSTTYNFELPGVVPEPATWAMMIGGFGMVGGSMRYRRRQTKVSYATA